MMVWKMMFLFNWVIVRFHLKFSRVIQKEIPPEIPPSAPAQISSNDRLSKTPRTRWKRATWSKWPATSDGNKYVKAPQKVLSYSFISCRKTTEILKIMTFNLSNMFKHDQTSVKFMAFFHLKMVTALKPHMKRPSFSWGDHAGCHA